MNITVWRGSSAKFRILKTLKTKIQYPSLILEFVVNPKRRNAEEPQCLDRELWNNHEGLV
ncbi:hypothetical protein DW669_06875 [Lachnospiraceae bacterium AM25-17]|nr:hypothetical protein DW669_06875 [Lachnospiraceae bacterium AM25-17]